MFGLAYRLLGSAADAEDVLQDAFLRWHGRDDVREPSAWLVRVVTNLCLNRLTSVRASRELYVGPWLPEPVFTGDGVLGPMETAEQRDSVSLALLVLMERLTPGERAVYVLREAFGYSHREVAEIVGYTEANCRQLHTRARRRLAADPDRSGAPDSEKAGALLRRFLAAATEGNLADLEELLADDVTSWADGGGRPGMARRPVLGRLQVSRYLVGSGARFGAGISVGISEINGVWAMTGWADLRMADRAGPGRLPWALPAAGRHETSSGHESSSGRESAPRLRGAGELDTSAVLVAVMVPEIAGGRIGALRIIGNPEKLAFAARQAVRMSRPTGVSGLDGRERSTIKGRPRCEQCW